MKKIIILIPTLTLGGGEKIAVENANDLSDLGYEVSIVLPRGIIQQKVNPGIKVISGSSRSLFGDVYFSWKSIGVIVPDIVISYMERANFINVILSIGKPWKVLASVHTVPSVAFKARGIVNQLFIAVTMNIIKKLNIPVLCVSEGVEIELSKIYGIDNTHFVKNYYSGPELMTNVFIPKINTDIIFGFVGRLAPVKGCDILVEAVALANERLGNNKKFWVVGDGTQKENLINLRRKLNIEEKIDFIGSSNNVDAILSEVDYLIVPSYVEGFGLVILEGLYQGCNIIYSKCKYGPNEIMKNFEVDSNCYAFSDPSIDPEVSVKELSDLILHVTEKKDVSKIPYLRSKLHANYGKKDSLEKLVEIIEG